MVKISENKSASSETGADSQSIEESQFYHITGINSIYHYKGLLPKAPDSDSNYPFIHANVNATYHHGNGGWETMKYVKYFRLTNLTTTTVDDPYIIFVIKGIDTSGAITTNHLCLHENESFIFMPRYYSQQAWYYNQRDSAYSGALGNALNTFSFITDMYIVDSNYENHYIELFIASDPRNGAY